MYPVPPWDYPLTEKFLAQIAEMHVRFKEVFEHNDRDYLRATPQSDAGQMIYMIPKYAAKKLHAESLRVGTLLKLENVRLRQSGVMLADEISRSDNEAFRIQVEGFVGSRKGIHTFRGNVAKSDSFPIEGEVRGPVEVGLRGKKALALKTLFSERQTRHMQVDLILDRLQEVSHGAFVQTVDFRP